MRAVVGIAALVLTLVESAPPDSFLCVASTSSEFTFNVFEKKWESVIEANESQYILAPTKGERDIWTLTRIGQEEPFILCRNISNGKDAFLSCGQGVWSFFVNTDPTMGYLITRAFNWGILSGEDYKQGDLTPYLESGNCSTL